VHAWSEIERCAEGRAREIVERNAARAIDAPTQLWLQRSAVVLAVYQELRSLAEPPRVLAVIREALTRPFEQQVGPYLEGRFGISAAAPQEAFVRISENFKKRGEERFGKAFAYEQDVQDGTRSFTNIARCFFNDFFRANGAPEVTAVFCALDKVWANALENGPYGVRFDRPTTLAQGDDVCRFQFSRA
jgi:L-2-amino-thiazoline-4-carboxylic acid hydrolase